MIKNIKKGLFFIAIVLATFILFQNQNKSNQEKNIKIIKNISKEDAEIIIEKQYLNIEEIEESFADTIYSIVEVDVTKNSSLEILTFKSDCSFYVFQNNYLIYSQKKDSFYQGNSLEEKKYYFTNTELWKKQVLHKIPIHSTDPIYILIQKEKNKQISDFINKPKLIEKNTQNLIETNIPILKINTHNNSLDTSKYTFTSNQLISSDINKFLLSKIKIRGNTSLSFPKKQFNIIFEEKSELNQLNLKKNVLISSYNDRSLMRNKIAYDLFSLIKSDSPKSEYIHLIINDIYEGLYLMTEHPEQQFQKLTKDSLTLNFLAQIDRGPFHFYGELDNTGYNIEFSDNLNEASIAINNFEKLVLNYSIGGKINDYELNINSFIDFIILNEISKNIDAYRLSTYLSFINKKISVDIVWDFDLSFGLANYNEGYNHEGFVIESEVKKYIPEFWILLWNNELIQEKLKKRYQLLRKDILSNKNIDKYIKNVYDEINSSTNHNFERWEILGKDIWPNKFNFKSHKEEVNYINEWIQKRLDFLDSKWN